MNIDQSQLATILASALEMTADDHTLVAWLAADVRRVMPGLNDDEVKVLTIAVVTALLDEGLVQVGIPDGPRFKSDTSSAQEIARRIADRWQVPVGDDHDVQYSLWISATPVGEEMARGKASQDAIGAAVRAADEALRGQEHG